MKNKNGFTLVELLAVIIILGLLMTLAIPSALKIQKNVKEKAYQTKIELIESSAKSYGEDIRDTVKSSTAGCNPSNSNIYNGSITSSYPYPCVRVTIKSLVDTNNMNYDEKNICTLEVNGCNVNYNNVVTNPINNTIVNLCYVYVYYKNNRIYSVFDKAKCDQTKTTASEGFQYEKLKK